MASCSLGTIFANVLAPADPAGMDWRGRVAGQVDGLSPLRTPLFDPFDLCLNGSVTSPVTATVVLQSIMIPKEQSITTRNWT